MHGTTFLADVQDGRIVTVQPLTEFEGKQVYVTLIAPEMQPRTVVDETRHTGPSVLPLLLEEAEILDDAGRIQAPSREVTEIHINLVDIDRLPMRVYASDMED